MQRPAQEEKSVLISSSNIWKSFLTGDSFTTILKGLTVDIEEGQFVILFGPSGCGKSTYLNTLIGLEYPDEGDVLFKGKNIWNTDSDQRAVIRKENIGIVYQQQNWIKALNVLENVSVVGTLLGMTQEEANRLAEEKLELVEMSHRSTYRPYELSSGEQQRISLARALMSNPSLIVADEPTGSLDMKAGYEVMDILKNLVEQGKSVLMVTHSIELLNFADRVIFMVDGKIVDDIDVKKEKFESIREKIVEKIEEYDSEDTLLNEKKKAPEPIKQDEEVQSFAIKNVFEKIWFNILFTFVMFVFLFLYIPSYLLESSILKNSNISSKVKSLIIKIINRFDFRREKDSISNWNIGEMSLKHLVQKKSRSIITVLGVGFGIGFITFLLSLGFGLEKLVISEIAEIEDMRQVYVNPIVSSEVVINDDKYGLIEDIEGVKEVEPLINVATRVYYNDSQTDLVAYGVNPSYLNSSREVFLSGENFEVNQKLIVVGEQVLRVLGIDNADIVGKEVFLEFIPVNKENILGEEVDDEKKTYVVAGVVSHSSSPVLFFSIEDAKYLGLDNYSELLLVLEEEADMGKVRDRIEKLGMKTSSIMDTVVQIEDFFFYLRIGLVIFGTIAFLIAILGMFNTLTVSLMERTREVGLLKSIGMRSEEIRRLFITESMLIAFWGGISGIIMGVVMGLILSLVISLVSVNTGGAYLIVSRIPIYFIFGIVFLSVVTGYITGVYPSKRAVKISALDALRYE